MKSKSEPASKVKAEPASKAKAPSVAEQTVEESLDLHTMLLCWITALMVAGAAWLLSSILVPIALALTLSIALAPLARRLERLGLGRVGSSLACLLLVTAILIGTGSLIAYQAGTMIQHSDEHLDRLGQLMTRLTKAVGGDRLLDSMGAIQSTNDGGQDQGRPEDLSRRGSEGAGAETGSTAPKVSDSEQAAYWRKALQNGAKNLSGWLVRGIGGLVGIAGSAVICLSFLFYFLDTRSDWLSRIMRILTSLGLRPRRECLERSQQAINVYMATVVMISVAGVLITGTTAWLLGIPQPFLWGLIFGLLEFIPYFGPMVGGTMMTLVAATSDEGAIWHAAAMLGVILVWMTLEGYVITPMIYGRAVEFDPVMVLMAVLFFGWLWGPFGMVTALPMMVLLRELVVMTPQTPALDVLMEP